jgi:antitoxin (DNA-binding transcriptional repressor) of toxin-antitoxin stability system
MRTVNIHEAKTHLSRLGSAEIGRLVGGNE